jgi:hypothetical protein
VALSTAPTFPGQIILVQASRHNLLAVVVVVLVAVVALVDLIHAQVQVTGLHRRLISTRSYLRTLRKRISMHAVHSSAHSGVRLLRIVAVVVHRHLYQVDRRRSLPRMRAHR